MLNTIRSRNEIKDKIVKFLSFFLLRLKYLEELCSHSRIKSLVKNGSNKVTSFEIGSECSDNNLFLTAYNILTQKSLLRMLKEDDIALIKSIAFAEGDIFLKEKNFNIDGKEEYCLFSILTNETWELQLHEIKNSPDIIKRLNIRYFEKDLFFQ